MGILSEKLSATFGKVAPQGYDPAVFAGLGTAALSGGKAADLDEVARFYKNPNERDPLIREGRQINPDQIAGFAVPGALDAAALLAAIEKKKEEDEEALTRALNNQQYLEQMRARLKELDAQIAKARADLEKEERRLSDAQRFRERLREDPAYAQTEEGQKEYKCITGEDGRGKSAKQMADDVARVETNAKDRIKTLKADIERLEEERVDVERRLVEKERELREQHERSGIAPSTEVVDERLGKKQSDIIDQKNALELELFAERQKSFDKLRGAARTKAIDKAIDEMSREARQKLQNNPNTPADVKARLSMKDIDKQRAKYAGDSEKAERAVQREVSRITDDAVREALLADPSTPDDVKNAILPVDQQIERFQRGMAEAAKIKDSNERTQAELKLRDGLSDEARGELGLAKDSDSTSSPKQTATTGSAKPLALSV